jgi:nucleotide-binding universal stress UspA family protein
MPGLRQQRPDSCPTINDIHPEAAHMTAIKKIMVPLAFSPISEGLLNYAASLAGPLGAELVVVSVINERDVEAVQRIASFGYEVDEQEYVKSIEQRRITRLQEMVKKLELDENMIHVIFKVGHPADILLKLALKEEVDMIVMGVKAKTEFVHAFTGSVAEKIFRRSPISVVSYRDEHTAQRLRKRLKS